MQEIDLILNKEMESYQVEEEDKDGKKVTKELQRPKSIAIRFFNILLSHLDLRAPRAWSRFEAYLDVIFSFATLGPEQIEQEVKDDKAQKWDSESDAYKIGMEYFFKEGFLTILGDFVLQEESPLYKEAKARPKMGSSSQIYGSLLLKPNFGSLLKLLVIMVGEQDLIQKYPITEVQKKMVESPSIMSMMMEPGDSSDSTDFSDVLNKMAKDNEDVTKQIAENILKGTSKATE